MTDYEYDEYDDTQINLSPRRLKKIPRWARSKYSFLKFLYKI
jgi:hypothetical protein